MVRTHSDQADVVVGTWKDKRIGLFRGLPKGKQDYGGTAYGEKGISTIGTYDGNDPLLEKSLSSSIQGSPQSVPKRHWRYWHLWKLPMKVNGKAVFRF